MVHLCIVSNSMSYFAIFHRAMLSEIIEVLALLIDRINYKEIDINLPYTQPLKIHARYTRDQILAAFGLSTFERKSPSREGVAENQALNTELLFINLAFSPVHLVRVIDFRSKLIVLFHFIENALLLF